MIRSGPWEVIYKMWAGCLLAFTLHKYLIRCLRLFASKMSKAEASKHGRTVQLIACDFSMGLFHYD